MTTRDRIAAVFGAGQGTGYLLSPRLVLTAAHLLRGGFDAMAVVPGGLGKRACHALWTGDDAALLVADEPLVAADGADGLEPTRFGRIDGLTPLMDCYAVGFPDVQRYDGERLDTEQFTGTIKPGSQTVRGDYVLDSVHTPPSAARGGGSPWAGMSGAPLFSGRYLVAVVTADPAGWQHGRLTAVPVHRLLSDPEFSSIYRGHVGAVRFTTLRRTPDDPAEFEQRYRSCVAEVHSELSIFGLDFSRPENAQWPLDSAYISLELIRHDAEYTEHTGHSGYTASGGSGRAGPEHIRREHDLERAPGGPHPAQERARADVALNGSHRVLLRGPAGSGKTTLVQWLAVNAARDSFGDRLAHLRGRVPFVLPMRTLVRGSALPAAGDLIGASGLPLTPPAGWVEAVLAEGRGLLLVDGVDEMPQEDRARTRRWLYALLAAYPDNVLVVTTRPTAVDDGWLARKEFTEFQLLPMNQQDVMAFTHRWFTAAASMTVSTAKRAHLDTFREQLLDALPRKRDLARLATNPLMCAMICALQRDRRGFLPDSRMKLYGAALTMLLVRRDRERAVAAPEGLEMSEEAQLKLLQETAYWMIRNGLAEAEQQQVVDLIARLLPSMPQVGTPDRAPDVFRFLLRRSGLLRAPTPQTVDFVHRTFLDYLGAAAAIEAQDINLIASHAHEPQWEDIVRMAVGHARDGERAVLLQRLMDLGDKAGESSPLRVRLHLLAAASLEHATSLDPRIRSEVERRCAALVPPKAVWLARELAEAGPVVLDLLPGPEGLTDDAAEAVVAVAEAIRGDHALRILRDFRNVPSPAVRVRLADAWPSFDAAAYAEQVLAPMRTDDIPITVSTPEQLAALPSVGAAGAVTFRNALSPAGIAAAAARVGVTELSIWGNPRLRDLTAFSALEPHLTGLFLRDCSHFVDYSSLVELGLERLGLTMMPASPTLSVLRSATTLVDASLDLEGSAGPLKSLPLPPGLTRLSLRQPAGMSSPLPDIGRCPGLTSLSMDIDGGVPKQELRHLASLPGLDELSCTVQALRDLTDGRLPPLPSVTRLSLNAHVHADADVRELRRVFPGLRELGLWLTCENPILLDATDLLGLQQASIIVVEGPLTLLGAELVPTPPIFFSSQEARQ